MFKKAPFLLLLCLTFVHADIDKTMEKFRDGLTHYYHKLLTGVDNSVKCDANCTHTEIGTIATNRIHLVTSIDNNLKPSLTLKGRIYLPKLSKKFRLTFSKQNTDPLTSKQIDRQNENLITDTTLRVGIQYLFKATEKLEFSTRLGLRIHKPFDLYQELALKRRFHIYRDLSLYTKAELHLYFAHLYLSRSLHMTLSKPINKNWLVAQTNDWYANTENRHRKHLVNHLKLHHEYSRKTHLVYWISYATLADNNNRYRKEWQALSLSYVHFQTKWFYVQLLPRVIKRREHRFRKQYEMTLSFGMILGK
jgi:hypothetical protein